MASRSLSKDWKPLRKVSAAEGIAVAKEAGHDVLLLDGVAENILLDEFYRRLDGFGELFRVLSFEQIGARAMLSRSVAGIARGKPLFALPGSTAAVKFGLDRLILPVLGHLLAEGHTTADKMLIVCGGDEELALRICKEARRRMEPGNRHENG